MKLKKMIRNCIAAVALAVVTLSLTAEAQLQFKALPLTNSAFPTAYAPVNRTNTVTITNSATWSPTGASLVNLAPLQGVPVWWDVATSAGGIGTSNTVLAVDLSSDAQGQYWASNAVSVTVAQTGTNVNNLHAYFALNNGTNVFSGYQWARWSYASTAQTNGVTLLQNEFKVVR